MLLDESVLENEVLFQYVVLLVVERGQDPGDLGDGVDEFAELGVVASGDEGHSDCELVAHLGQKLVVHLDPQVAVVLQLAIQASFEGPHLFSELDVPRQTAAYELKREEEKGFKVVLVAGLLALEAAE